MLEILLQKRYNTPGPFALTSMVDSATKEEQRKADRMLYRYAHKASKLNMPFKLIRATGEDIGKTIIEVASSEEIDIIVMGRRGMGQLKRLVVGSVSKYVTASKMS